MRTPDPIAFSLLGLDIRWYGILIAAGAMLAVFLSCRRAPKHGLEAESVLDIVLWMIPVGILFARIYYVLFNWSYYGGDAFAMINIRNGGLAIHGGLLGGLLATYGVCRYKKIEFLNAADLILPTVALAQSIGRWGNFFNGEAHGTATDLPWAILVNGERVHPTFLYESLWCLLMFFLLLRADDRRRFPGQTTCLYGLLYAPERFLVEGLRTDSLMIGPFRQAQVISIILFAVCLFSYRKLQDHQQQRRSKP